MCRGDTTNTNLQNMEPVSETDQEPVPEDLGKLTEADKARSGRVSLNVAFDVFEIQHWLNMNYYQIKHEMVDTIIIGFFEIHRVVLLFCCSSIRCGWRRTTSTSRPSAWPSSFP